MRVLTGYIVKEILKGSLVALLLLLTLFNLFTFSDELGDLGGGYGLKQILYYLALTTPGIFCELVPASALLGSLFVLGAMGNNRELIAMRAAGLSVFGIIKAVMLAGAVLVISSILVSEFVAPVTERMAKMVKFSARNEQVLMNAKDGVWLREDKKFINIRKIVDDHHLADISIYQLDDQHHLLQAIHADEAFFQGHRQWGMKNIKTSDISIEQMRESTQDNQIWESSIAPNVLKSVVVNPNNLALSDLASQVDFLKKNHQESHTFELAFWQRIVNPLVTFIMLLISAPFIISVKRGVSVGERMMLGVVIGMGFKTIDSIVGHFGLIYDLSPPLMAFIPSLTLLALALLAVNRIQE